MLGHFGAMLSQLGVRLGDLGAMLGLCWAILGPCWAYVGRSWGHVGPMLGLCWAILGLILGHVGPSWDEKTAFVEEPKTAKNTANCGAASGLRPGALPEYRACWPDLSAYARQPARGPTMWAHFVAMLAYVGLCWSILRAIWAHLVARLASG